MRQELDVTAFRRAWALVTTRHAMLRATVVSEQTAWPLQVIRQHVDVPWVQEDWIDDTPDGRERQVRDYLRADRTRGFAMGHEPLMRMHLAGNATAGFEFTWTFHHLILDGWSLPIVLRDVISCYEAFREGREPDLPRPPSFGSYIRWLRAQDLQQAEQYWRAALAGFDTPSRLDDGILAAEATPIEYGQASLHIARSITGALRKLARAHRLTLHTILQGSWALVASRMTGQTDVVFGSTVSGRPASLPGVESIVGPFINTVPVRVRVPAREPWPTWLQRLQEEQTTMRQFDARAAAATSSAGVSCRPRRPCSTRSSSSRTIRTTSHPTTSNTCSASATPRCPSAAVIR